MQKTFLTIIIVFVAGFVLIGIASAQSPNQGVAGEVGRQLEAAAGEHGAGLGQPADPRETVAKIIRQALSILGILFLCLTVYAGFLWMTAGGNDEQIEKAKKLLYRGVIGLAIILSAYAITWAAYKLVTGRLQFRGRDSFVTEPGEDWRSPSR